MLPFILSGALIAIITAQRETARRRALVAEQEVNTYADKLELDNHLLNKEHIYIEVRDAEAKQTQVHAQYPVGSRHTDLHPASRDDSSLWFVISQTIVEWYNGRIRYTASSNGGDNTCSIELPSY